MSKRNFLLGRGERLAEPLTRPSGPVIKEAPYTITEAKVRLAPMIAAASEEFAAMPSIAAPDERVVAKITLNPEYIAKSYYPTNLLREVGLKAVGSHPRLITPAKRSKNRTPEPAVTTELFVVGTRQAFKNWADGIASWNEETPASKQLASIEEIHAPKPTEKIKGPLPEAGSVLYEVILHADENTGEASILPRFANYLRALSLDAGLDRRFYASGLCFLQLEAPVARIEEIATFSIVRAIRQMPTLRVLRPTIRAAKLPSVVISLPTDGPLDASIRAAIFDGGLPANHVITRWATPIDTTGSQTSHSDYLSHGAGVTSAFLFGHLDPNAPVPRPFCNVDHYRVLDAAPGQDPGELFEVLERIQTVLTQRKYDLINLSLGPILSVDDDEVHAWTAVLDQLLATGDTLATIAVGNTGESDEAAGLNRIQVPADSVNALAIGACDSPDVLWQRAAYSSVGPGRSPGLVKPDFVAFGGSTARPFLVVGSDDPPTHEPTGGTSFAAPSVLRLGAGVRAHFGSSLNMLAIRALLVHGTEATSLPKYEVGRGRCSQELESFVICPDDTVRVVYQGIVSPAKYLRASIPLPAETLMGRVLITATLCYSTGVDPHHPDNYTRAGLELTFRPNSEKRKKPEQVHPDSQNFFGKSQQGATEVELRKDAWKWENTLHGTIKILGSSLKNPVFDLHYNSRLEGHDHNPGQQLSYALIISIKAAKEADLYDRVVRRYNTILEPLRPVIDIPVRI